MALLCRRDARRFLERTRQARAQASVSATVPGSAQSERYFNTCVALGEALLGVGSPRNLKWLEESAADAQVPPLQLLASLGLAVTLERSDDTARAEQLRAFVRQAAPHCAALHLKAEDFAEGASQPELPAMEGGFAPPRRRHRRGPGECPGARREAEALQVGGLLGAPARPVCGDVCAHVPEQVVLARADERLRTAARR